MTQSFTNQRSVAYSLKVGSICMIAIVAGCGPTVRESSQGPHDVCDRERSQANLKTIGQAVSLYEADYDFCFPPTGSISQFSGAVVPYAANALKKGGASKVSDIGKLSRPLFVEPLKSGGTVDYDLVSDLRNAPISSISNLDSMPLLVEKIPDSNGKTATLFADLHYSLGAAGANAPGPRGAPAFTRDSVEASKTTEKRRSVLELARSEKLEPVRAGEWNVHLNGQVLVQNVNDPSRAAPITIKGDSLIDPSLNADGFSSEEWSPISDKIRRWGLTGKITKLSVHGRSVELCTSLELDDQTGRPKVIPEYLDPAVLSGSKHLQTGSSDLYYISNGRMVSLGQTMAGASSPGLIEYRQPSRFMTLEYGELGLTLEKSGFVLWLTPSQKKKLSGSSK